MEQENLQQAEELNNNETTSPDTLNDETQNEVSVQGQPTPIEKAPEKEVPVWDFSSFNTDEIISHMKSLIDDFPVQRLKVLDSLPQVFEAQYQREYDKALADFTKDGSPAEAFDYQDNSKERFYSVYRTYREKKTEYYKKLEGEKEQNLKEKLQIIEELKKLGREDIVVIAGGVIPAQDYDFLYKAGVAAIFGPGTPVAKAACQILEILMDEE